MTMTNLELLPMSKSRGALLILLLTSIILGTYAGGWIFPLGLSDPGLYFGFFLGLPLFLSIIGILVGRNAKNQVDYSPIEWTFETVQLEISEVKELLKEYPRKYRRLVSYGPFWLFYAPFVIITAMLTLPMFVSVFEAITILLAVPFYAILFFILSTLAYELGFSVSQNTASSDFTLSMVREAIWLAKTQSTTPGISYTRVALDKAEWDGYAIYRHPRVIHRIECFEEDAYIEAWSEELGSIYRIHCHLYDRNGDRNTSWWWMSRDRHFRKYATEEPDDFYYVRQPVPKRIIDPGVKDVQYITENAVAIVIIEYMKSRGARQDLQKVLSKLGVEEYHKS